MDLTIPLTGGTATVIAGVVGWFFRERWNEEKRKRAQEEERKAAELQVMQNDLYGHLNDCNERREHSAAVEQKISGIDDRLCGVETKVDSVHTKCDTITGQLSVLIARGK